MNQEEKVLRENIRRLIRHVKQKKLNEENDLRVVIQQMMDLELSEGQTPDVDPAPNKSTGINVLEELLKKIIPIIETDYKSLTTNSDQRQSYRAHVLNAVDNSLTPARINNQAGEAAEASIEEIEINVGGNEPDDKFIDIRTDAEKASEEPEEEDPLDGFGTVLKAMKLVAIWLIKVTRKLKLLFLILMNCCRTLKIKNCFMITLSQI